MQFSISINFVHFVALTKDVLIYKNFRLDRVKILFGWMRKNTHIVSSLILRLFMHAFLFTTSSAYMHHDREYFCILCLFVAALPLEWKMKNFEFHSQSFPSVFFLRILNIFNLTFITFLSCVGKTIKFLPFSFRYLSLSVWQNDVDV